MVETAVLFQTFARPDYARQVFNAIKRCEPRKLYFYCNKARVDRPDELSRNEEVRSLVQEVDWDCELHTWFREEYVDVYSSLKSAVDWVCENEQAWITLEEDIVPTPAFFSFCDQMIEYYRYNNRVWYVSGDNFFNYNPGGFDYIFSSYHWLFGWATWRDRWLAVNWEDLGIELMIKQRVLDHLYITSSQVRSRELQLIRLKDFLERTKCWDYIFGVVCDQNNAVGVFPNKHLITNIGHIGEHHATKRNSFINNASTYSEPTYLIEKRPPFIFADYEYDLMCQKRINSQKSLRERVVPIIKRLLGIEK